jgi:uncharacterized protein YbcV (DUF1398 family)
MTKFIYSAKNPGATTAVAATVATFTATTASLATNASADVNYAVAESGILVSFTADRACLVRVYDSATARAADTRTYNQAVPSAGVTGLIVELEIDPAIAATLDANVVFANNETPKQGAVYARVFNLASTGIVQLDVRVVKHLLVDGALTSSSVAPTFVPVNAPTLLTQGGYYFTNSLASNIEASFSSPPVGTYVKWYNDSTKSVIISGFTTINGSSIPANQGIAVVMTSMLEFYSDTIGNAKILSGAQNLAYIPGQEPPGFAWWRVDFNWILTEIQFYYEDAPNTVVTLNGGNIVSFTRSATYSTGALQYESAVLNDGSSSLYTGRTDGLFQSYIINIPINKNVSAVHLMGQSSGNNRPTEVRLYKGSDASTWVLVKTWTGSPLSITDGTGSKFIV